MLEADFTLTQGVDVQMASIEVKLILLLETIIFAIEMIKFKWI